MRFKKSLGLGLVVGLLAMAFAALPALAGAAQLTDESGSAVETPATISAASENAETILTPGGLLVCKRVDVHGILTTNSGGSVVVTMDEAGVDTATDCTLEGKEVTVEPTLEGINLSGSAGTASFSFKLGAATEFSTSAVEWSPPASSAHVSGAVTGSVPGSFSGDFTFTDEGGRPLTLD